MVCKMLDGATYTAKTKFLSGGVGRNIAEGIWKLYGNVRLISAVGNDEIGKNLKQTLPLFCTETVIKNTEYSTSICNVLFDKSGDCKLILGDMDIHKSINPEMIMKNAKLLSQSPIIVMDSNVSIDAMGTILEIAIKYNKPVFFEPTDMRYATKPFQLPRILTKQIKIISPNIYELEAIANLINSTNESYDIKSISKSKDNTLKIAKKLLQTINGQFDCVLLTLGVYGVIVDGPNDISTKFFDENFNYNCRKVSDHSKTFYFNAPTVNNIKNVSGAGDSFTSGFISYALQRKSLQSCVGMGFYAASKALQSESPVPNQYFTDDKEILNLQNFNGISI